MVNFESLVCRLGPFCWSSFDAFRFRPEMLSIGLLLSPLLSLASLPSLLLSR